MVSINANHLSIQAIDSKSVALAYIKCPCFGLRSHNVQDSPIFQLQVTFAALQEGTQNVFNPAKLVESLKLRTTEQQDAQECVLVIFFVKGILIRSAIPGSRSCFCLIWMPNSRNSRYHRSSLSSLTKWVRICFYGTLFTFSLVVFRQTSLRNNL